MASSSSSAPVDTKSSPQPTPAELAAAAKAAADAKTATPAAAAPTPVSWGTFITTLLTVFLVPIIFGLLFAYGAAKLSFDKYGSFGWALLDFVFPMFYYPFYAVVLNKPTAPSIMGAMRGGFQAAMRGGRK